MSLTLQCSHFLTHVKWTYWTIKKTAPLKYIYILSKTKKQNNDFDWPWVSQEHIDLKYIWTFIAVMTNILLTDWTNGFRFAT